MRTALRAGLSLGTVLLLTAFFTACASKRTTASTRPTTTAGTTPRTDTAQVAAAQREATQGETIVRVNNAITAFDAIMAAPDKGIPTDLLNRAQCIAVVPGLKKGALGIGAQFGKGFFACRKANGEGWTAPAAIRIEGGSFGLQIGGQESDVVMLVMNKQGEDRLLSSQFTLGGDASVAAGPVGRQAQAQTSANLTAQILTWARSRGAFAGVSLQGATLREDLDSNRALYGKTLTNRDIIQGNIPTPAAARPFDQMLEKYSPRQTIT